MNKAIYEKNMEMLGNKYPVWQAILKTVNRKKEIFM